MRTPAASAPVAAWQLWGRAVASLLLILLGPLALFWTPLHTLALTWAVLLVLALWTFLIAA